MDKLKSVNGVSYKMKKSMQNKFDLTGITDPVKLKTIETETAYYNDSVTETARYGFIAQELREVFPELVDENEEGYLNIDYVGLIPVLVEAIKELEAKIIIIENNCCKKTETLKSGSINSNLLSPGVRNPMLYQNTPNPFNLQTTIKFEIPETVQNAQLYICNMTGTLLKTIAINQRQGGNVTINANEFNAGMYLYSLVCDGKIEDTKQMLLTQ